jgi:hypothetical protein
MIMRSSRNIESDIRKPPLTIVRLLDKLPQRLRRWIGHAGPFGGRQHPPLEGLRYNLARLQASDPSVRIQGAAIKVEKAPPTWSFIASLRPDRPVLDKQAGGPAVMDVALEVTAGTVGVMLLERGTSTGSINETLVRPEDGKTTVRLFVPRCSTAGQLVFRNAGDSDTQIALRVHKVEFALIDLRAAVDDSSVMHAFYDLTIYPGTFDFAYFLMATEIARQKAGLKSLHVYIVRPGRDALSRLPRDYDAAVDAHAREWRISNVLLPILTLFPSVRGYSVLPDRIAASALREHLSNAYPGPLDSDAVPIHEAHLEVNRELARTPAALRPQACMEGLRFVRQWIQARAPGRKLVTITLRQYEFLTLRNSNTEAWVAFAKELTRDGYFPVIVPDTVTALDPPPLEFSGIAIFPEAAHNILLRMALYELAYLNFATTGGPAALLLLSERCRFLLLKLLIPEVPLCSAEHLAKSGLTIGLDPTFLSVTQHIVWEHDDLPIIRREFDAMVAKIEGDTLPASASPTVVDRG